MNKIEKNLTVKNANSIFYAGEEVMINGKIVTIIQTVNHANNMCNNNNVSNSLFVQQDLTAIITHTALEEIEHNCLLDLHINIDPHAKPFLSITADESMLDSIHVVNHNGCLKISTKGSYITTQPIKVFLVAPYLNKIVQKGQGEISGNYIGKDLIIDVDGMGDVKLTGYVERLDLTHTGMANSDLEHLCAEHITVKLKGMGDAKVWAKESCFAKNSGMGNLSIFGESKKYTAKNSGMGNIEQIHGKKESKESTNQSKESTNEVEFLTDSNDTNKNIISQQSVFNTFKKKLKSIL
jgi:hypothetical protein